MCVCIFTCICGYYFLFCCMPVYVMWNVGRWDLWKGEWQHWRWLYEGNRRQPWLIQQRSFLKGWPGKRPEAALPQTMPGLFQAWFGENTIPLLSQAPIAALGIPACLNYEFHLGIAAISGYQETLLPPCPPAPAALMPGEPSCSGHILHSEIFRRSHWTTDLGH